MSEVNTIGNVFIVLSRGHTEGVHKTKEAAVQSATEYVRKKKKDDEYVSANIWEMSHVTTIIPEDVE